ncbi:coenzyme F420-0:L-glutamate ligase [Candidatus Peregrinibacteria bacterium]|nr:coenzyme F420-0:L-glutamate ligase [Candidatus Peregrinibacteria bacterium]
MLLLPIHTRLLENGDDLISLLQKSTPVSDGDILIISSKAVATVEGAAIDLRQITPSNNAEKWSKACGRSAAFCQAVLDETKRLHGEVVGTCPGALLTELRPDGLTEGTIFAANAGLDQSNVADGFAIGWPRDPVASVQKLRMAIEKSLLVGSLARCSSQKKRTTSNQQPATQNNHCIAVIVSDSCCIPRRRGVTAHALAVSGIDPLHSEMGNVDLFGKPLRITIEARADQLATAANILMGNAGQGVPAAIIRDHGIPLTRFEGWVPGIEPENDLFRALLRQPRHTSAADRSAEFA